MKRIIVLLLGLSATLSSFCQAPPVNDNLTNATVLSGTDVTFSGTLTGATLEGSADSNASLYETPTGSVWWSWTAPVTTVLTIDLLHNQSTNDLIFNTLNVYATTNGITSPAGLPRPPLASLFMYSETVNPSLSLPVLAGSNYLIQLVGATTNAIYSFHLLCTNMPLIVRQPSSRTVYSNGSAFFYVECDGLQPRSYQWFFNGTNLPGQTYPILSLTNITATNVGCYYVFVSNTSGSIMSAPAMLAISASNIPPILKPVSVSSNLLTFSLTGELGRYYIIQSSSNLVDWVPENSFAADPPIAITPEPLILSSIFTTNSPSLVTVTNNSASKYYRVYIYKTEGADSEICINNLGVICAAELLWAHDTAPATDTYLQPIDPYLAVYTPLSNISCPDNWLPVGVYDDPYVYFDTSYSIGGPPGIFGPVPSCLIATYHHVLPGFPTPPP